MSLSIESPVTTATQNRVARAALSCSLLLTIVCGCGSSVNDGKPATETSGGRNSSSRPGSSDTTTTPDDKPSATEPVTSQTLNTTPVDPSASESSSPSTTFPGAKLINAKPPFLAAILVDHADHVYREGDKLNVRFQAEQDAHLYLLYHQSDGSTVLLFPNEANRDGRVAAKTPVTIPPADNSFRFRVSPPFGTEHLQVIASTKPLTDLDGLIQKAGRAPAISADLLTKLDETLKQDASIWTEHHVRITTQPKTSVGAKSSEGTKGDK